VRLARILAIGWCLAPPAAAWAQEEAAATTLPPANVLDFGLRGSSLSGDAARYERYRDLGDGLFLETARWGRQSGDWFLNVAGEHVGRRDQRFQADFTKPGRLKFDAMWDQIPMLMSRTTRTLFSDTAPGVLTVDDGIQAQVQATPGELASLFASSSRVFDMKSRRHVADGGMEYLVTPDLTLSARLRHTDRSGVIPYGGSFGHSSLVETPAPIEHRLVDVDAGAEFQRGRFLARGGYTGSFFQNDVTTLVFDNPFRLTDSPTASSGGRLSLAPSNSFVSVNGLASVTLPQRTRATASVSVGSLRSSDDAMILPHTINSALPAPALERTALDGEARTMGLNLALTSRPVRGLDLSIRYRGYEYDNRTPVLTIGERVAYDNSVSVLPEPRHTEPYGLTRHVVEADARMGLAARTSAGIGFTRTIEDRTHRIFESTTDNAVRVTFDAPGSRWFTLRTRYEHAEKRGTGDAARIVETLSAVGEQPGMRHFDIASRDRDRVTVIGSAMPAENVSLTFSVAAGKDDYIESLFGLRDNTHRVYSVGLDSARGEQFTFGGSYEYERFNALSRSRQANPGVQFDDPSRNWATDATDRVHSVVVTAGLVKIANRIDVNVSYDYNRARALYAYLTGPVVDRTLPEEIDVPTSLPPPSALPVVRSDLQRGTMDFIYAWTARVGVGVSYWYEQYRVSDFTLDAQANPELARGQALLIGYLYEPYTAHTMWGRLIYRW
jgi:MtrB/PioB family decaheme-associated outer membrane protein